VYLCTVNCASSAVVPFLGRTAKNLLHRWLSRITDCARPSFASISHNNQMILDGTAALQLLRGTQKSLLLLLLRCLSGLMRRLERVRFFFLRIKKTLCHQKMTKLWKKEARNEMDEKILL
jgi:hypothetical protein